MKGHVTLLNDEVNTVLAEELLFDVSFIGFDESGYSRGLFEEEAWDLDTIEGDLGIAKSLHDLDEAAQFVGLLLVDLAVDRAGLLSAHNHVE